MKQIAPVLLFILTSIVQVRCTNKMNNKVPGTDQEVLSDSVVFDIVQKQTFNYFWDGAEPVSGLARERIHSDNVYPENDQTVITSGGSGFGVMAIIVGMERGFISREDGRKRMEKILTFLEKADRFHGGISSLVGGHHRQGKAFQSER